jgi:hypothetical protein
MHNLMELDTQARERALRGKEETLRADHAQKVGELQLLQVCISVNCTRLLRVLKIYCSCTNSVAASCTSGLS